MTTQTDFAMSALAARAVTPTVDVLALSCGEIAVALHIAGLPTRWHHMSAQALMDLATEGITKVGLDEVSRLDAETRRIGVALHHLMKNPAADVTDTQHQLHDIWTSDRRQQNAIDAAWTIFHPIPHAWCPQFRHPIFAMIRRLSH